MLLGVFLLRLAPTPEKRIAMPAPSKRRVPADERLYDDITTAERLGVSRSTVKRMRRDGELPTVYVRGAARTPKSAVDAILGCHDA